MRCHLCCLCGLKMKISPLPAECFEKRDTVFVSEFLNGSLPQQSDSFSGLFFFVA